MAMFTLPPLLHFPFPFLFSLFLLPNPSTQVNVILRRFMDVRAECTNLPPGICCRAPILPGEYAPGALHPPSDINFRFLLPGDIAAGWKRRGDIHGCSGYPYSTAHGPGNVHMNAWEPMRPMSEDNYFTGASYISVPASLPAGVGGKSLWLQAEGVMGLVWGGGEWFADVTKVWGVPGATRRRRGIISELKGTVYAVAPGRWVFPDEITVNGMVYVSGNTSALDYVGGDGRRLRVLAEGG
ncbi:MAG: hypothetical protein Q9195_008426 [Heterodermia aff. obscurata]